MSQMKSKDRSRNNKYRASIVAEQMDVVHGRASIVAEHMDVVHGRASIIEEEEDRISNLPNEIIHQILSFLDMKYAIQTSTLSKKWKNIWTSMPHLNLNSRTFRSLPRFAKFVNDALSHRNHRTKVSAVELAFGGAPTEFAAVVTSIVNYAYSHNIRQLTLVWFRFNNEVLKFPQRLFSSHTLKHLVLATHYFDGDGLSVPESAWDFPALETLNLSNMRFGGDIGDRKSFNLFSKCVNLKDLTLHHCDMSYVDVFSVCAPHLSNLTIIDPVRFPKVFNVVAPQLESLTASVRDYLSYFLPLSTEDLDSLEKVNLSMRRPLWEKESYASGLLDLFQKLCRAKFLILDNDIIEVLSACLDQLSYEPCPFNNLKFLKQRDPTQRMPTQVRNYLLESSPSATFIMDLPQVPHKRSRHEAEKGTMANPLDKEKQQTKTVDQEKRMLEAKLFKQDEVIAEQKAMLEAIKVHHEKKLLEAKIHVQDEIIAQQKKAMHENGTLEEKIQMQDKVIAEQKTLMETMKLQHEKKMLEVKIQMQDELIAQQKKVMHENGMLEEKIQMQDKVIAEQKAMLEIMKLQNEKKMSEAKIQRQDKIIAEQKAVLEAMKLQHEQIETELGNIDSLSDVRTSSSNIMLQRCCSIGQQPNRWKWENWNWLNKEWK